MYITNAKLFFIECRWTKLQEGGVLTSKLVISHSDRSTVWLFCRVEASKDKNKSLYFYKSQTNWRRDWRSVRWIIEGFLIDTREIPTSRRASQHPSLPDQKRIWLELSFSYLHGIHISAYSCIGYKWRAIRGWQTHTEMRHRKAVEEDR